MGKMVFSHSHTLSLTFDEVRVFYEKDLENWKLGDWIRQGSIASHLGSIITLHLDSRKEISCSTCIWGRTVIWFQTIASLYALFESIFCHLFYFVGFLMLVVALWCCKCCFIDTDCNVFEFFHVLWVSISFWTFLFGII